MADKRKGSLDPISKKTVPASLNPTTNAKPSALKRQLFLTSFAILFFELICIRWIPSYVRSLGFFMNFILLASFLGIGVGILAGRREKLKLPPFALMMLILIATVAITRFDLRITSTQVLYYGSGEEDPSRKEHFYVLPLLFFLTAAAFVPLARPLGRLLNSLPPLQAYAVDILGSLAGIASFFLMSWFSLPPWVWFSLLGIVLLPALSIRQILWQLPFFVVCVELVFFMGTASYWSPYYRVEVSKGGDNEWIINVNNVGHQTMSPYKEKESFYFAAYDLLGSKPFKRALVLGAGSGSDVAIALHNGVEEVDGAEIDPLIARLGRELNFNKPYQDPRVKLHITDGREFLRNTPKRYDLIIFALPDSLTLTSAFANLRLESFLLTTEAIESARDHLTDDGLVVLYNYYRKDWLIRKLAGMIDKAFGEPPFVTTYGDWGRAAVFMAGPRLATLDLSRMVEYSERANIQMPFHPYNMPIIGQGFLSADPGLPPATDDWPFVYMPKRTLPLIYLGALGTAGVIALLFLFLVAPRATLRKFDWHFFFLGAAFMLLETRSLVTFALLFGATWMINSLVFFAILTSVLIAIFVSARLGSRWVKPLYAALILSLILVYLIPLRTMLTIESPALRYALASLLTFAPIFLANLVFTRSFRDTESADIAFASNLLGIMFGGMFEYIALITGYQALVWLVAAFYIIAFFADAKLRRAKIAT